MNRISRSQMADDNDPDAPAQPDLVNTPSTAGPPACGRSQELSGDVVGEVVRVCPRCTGTGPDCLIDLMYAEAFPSQRRH